MSFMQGDILDQPSVSLSCLTLTSKENITDNSSLFVLSLSISPPLLANSLSLILGSPIFPYPYLSISHSQF